MHNGKWQLQEAKSRFSEVVNQALTTGPQLVTRRGHDAVVIVAAEEYRRSGTARRPAEFFRQEPFLDGVDFGRDRSLPRDVELCDS